ncbi:hypothetical protein D3C86_1743410 [compost metagenome]
MTISAVAPPERSILSAYCPKRALVASRAQRAAGPVLVMPSGTPSALLSTSKLVFWRGETEFEAMLTPPSTTIPLPTRPALGVTPAPS